MAALVDITCVGDPGVLEPAIRVADELGLAVRERGGPRSICLAALDGVSPDELAAIRQRSAGDVVWLTRGAAPVPYAQLSALGMLRRLASIASPLELRDLGAVLATSRDPAAWRAEAHFADDHATTQLRLRSTGEKRAVLDELERFFAAASSASRARIRQVADELVTNALFDAPIDGDGCHLYRERERWAEIALDAAHEVAVAAWIDDARIGVAVTDSFGSFELDRFDASLARGFGRGADQIADTLGGAGLGLYTVCAHVSHLSVRVSPRRSTTVLAVVDRLRRRAPAFHGMNVFEC